MDTTILIRVLQMEADATAVLPVVKFIPTPWYVPILTFLLGLIGLVIRNLLSSDDPTVRGLWTHFVGCLGNFIRQALTWLIVCCIWVSMRWWVVPYEWLEHVIWACTWRGAYWSAPFVAWLSDSIFKSILKFTQTVIDRFFSDKGSNAPAEK